MSLDWDISEIENYEELKVKTKEGWCLKQQTNDLVWMCMAVDLNGIKESNVDEWLFRLHILNRTSGGEFDDLLDRKVIERHIGLGTNVSNVTRTKWLARVRKNMISDAEYWVRTVGAKEDKPKLRAVK